jgi:hypothetical protein
MLWTMSEASSRRPRSPIKCPADAEQLVPGNDMAFRLVTAAERAAIIDYLKK